MSSWTPRTSNSGLEYGGSANPYYWDSNNNPGASFWYCMANCTTYAFGRILEAGDPAPITGWHNANEWHNYLTNGWTYEAYSPHTIRQGDIVEWAGANTNHVAIIEQWDSNLGIIYVTQSFYTGDDGTVNSSRTLGGVMGNSLQSVSDWMLANVPYRFFNYDSLYSAGLGDPDYILRNPGHQTPVGQCKFLTSFKRSKRRRTLYV